MLVTYIDDKYESDTDSGVTMSLGMLPSPVKELVFMSFPLMSALRGNRYDQGLGFQTPMWENWIEFPTPGFSLSRFQLCMSLSALPFK